MQTGLIPVEDSSPHIRRLNHFSHAGDETKAGILPVFQDNMLAIPTGNGYRRHCIPIVVTETQEDNLVNANFTGRTMGKRPVIAGGGELIFGNIAGYKRSEPGQ